MSKITNDKINDHTSNVTSLKKQFLEKYVDDHAKAIEILRQIRIIHGCALYDNEIDLYNAVKKNPNDISEEEYIRLSTNASFLGCIKKNVKLCEKLLFNEKRKASNVGKNIGTDLNIGNIGNISYKNIVAKIKQSQSNTDELCLENITTEYNNTNPIFSEAEKSHNTNVGNTTEFIDNLTSTEAKNILPTNNTVSEYENAQQNATLQNVQSNVPAVETNVSTPTVAAAVQPATTTQATAQQGGDIYGNPLPRNLEVNKPTVVNYYAKWCPASQTLLPNWQQFKNLAKQKYPELQVIEIDTAVDPKFEKIATDAGVDSFPTVILYANDRTFSVSNGNMSADKLLHFVTKNLR